MEKWPDWFMEALKLRFDRSALLVEKNYRVAPFLELIEYLKNEIKLTTNEPTLQLLTQFEDTLTRKHSIEKECLYMQGVQDGIRIIYPALHSSDFR